MNLFKRILIYALASHALISSLFMVNIYAEFDTTKQEHDKCFAYVKKHRNAFCFDIVLLSLDYCPIQE